MATKKSSNLDTNFKIVKIGKQEWMVENLNVDRFRNGDLIPEVKSPNEWEKAGKSGKPAWCYFENDDLNGEKYGKLYNWFAVNDPRGLAPEGWHIPSDKEWSILIKFFFTEDEAGISLKSQQGWNSYESEESDDDSESLMISGNGSNSSGFYGLPGGCRYEDGQFCDIGDIGNWWSSSLYDTNLAWSVNLRTFFDNIETSWSNRIEYGYSVRCTKDKK